MFKWEKCDVNAPTDRADFIVCWIKDLLDLNAKQTTGCLRDKSGFCCLGIATNRAGYKWTWDEVDDQWIVKINDEEYGSALPYDLTRFLKTNGDNVIFFDKKPRQIPGYPQGGELFRKRFLGLIPMNDSGISFRAIAKIIQSECFNIFEDLTEDEKSYILAYKIPTRRELREAAKKESSNV